MNLRLRFSLLELIITLGILAVVSTMLLDNFADVKARQCGNITRERGERIRTAILGSQEGDGVGGFLSDMGRLPCVYIPKATEGGDGDGGRRLAELYDGSIWHTDTALQTTALSHVETIDPETVELIVKHDTSSTFPTTAGEVYYPEISMAVGWRGPYLSHSDPLGGKLYDGWGRGWRIVSNYNLKRDTATKRLVENLGDGTAEDHIKIYGTTAEIEALRNPDNDTRIDGLVSYGGNDVDDRGALDTDAADEDQMILFPFHSDDTEQGIWASLEIELKIREPGSNLTQHLPEIRTWKSGYDYQKGVVVAQGNSLYYCKTPHTSAEPFSATGTWINLTNNTKTPDIKDGNLSNVQSNIEACVHKDMYKVREGTGWKTLGHYKTYPESLSLLLAVPVKTGDRDERVFHLGAYHFYRNGTKENEFGVKPIYYSGTTTLSQVWDVDCLGDTTTTVGTTALYNKRYLIAEDHTGDEWNEFKIHRLVPGHRRLFVIGYNSKAGVSLQSRVEHIELRPGSNHITVYLEIRK